MTDKNRIFAAAIVGPTGVGKTKTSVLLAKKINAQIVSADSMQVYRHMDIGTAKASEDEMCGVKHYMLSVAEPWEEYNVVRYAGEAKKAVNEIFENGFFPLVVGGPGHTGNILKKPPRKRDANIFTKCLKRLIKKARKKFTATM